MAVRWMAAVAIVALLAGCSGKASGVNQVQLGDGSQVSLDLPPEQQPAEDDIRGAVSGIVVNDAVYPVAGAKVRILSLGTELVTDADGRFVYESLPPGLLTVEATKAGHAVGLGTVNVRSGEVTKAILMAERLPVQEPYHVTIVIDEFHSASNAVSESATKHLVALDSQPASMVVESFWEGLQAAPAMQPLQFSVSAESDPEVVQAGGGPNPLHLPFAADWFPAGEHAVRVQVSPTRATTPPQVTGRIFVSLFYIDPAPEGWSFVAGDP